MFPPFFVPTSHTLMHHIILSHTPLIPFLTFTSPIHPLCSFFGFGPHLGFGHDYARWTLNIWIWIVDLETWYWNMDLDLDSGL